jgi:hypothetical protein
MVVPAVPLTPTFAVTPAIDPSILAVNGLAEQTEMLKMGATNSGTCRNGFSWRSEDSAAKEAATAEKLAAMSNQQLGLDKRQIMTVRVAGLWDASTRTIPRVLSMSSGNHQCIGQPLARLEARVAFEEWFARVSSFERAGQPQFTAQFSR